MLGHIDSPAAASLVSGHVLVRGWAYSASSPVSKVEIYLGDRLVGHAGLRRPRPDVAAALSDPGAELSGFEFYLDLSDVEGHAGLTAQIELLDGSLGHLPNVNFEVAPAHAIDGREDVPSPRARRCPDKVRLLCVERSIGGGGSQFRLLELVQHLQGTGRFEIAVLAAGDGAQRQLFEAAGADVAIAPLAIDDAQLYERQLTDLVTSYTSRFDLILGFTLSNFPAIELAERLGLPSIWRIGEIEPLPLLTHWLHGQSPNGTLALRALRAFRVASLVVFNSKAALSRHGRHCRAGHVAVLGSGVDVEGARTYAASASRASCRRDLGLGDRGRVLVCAATKWPVKGQALLVDALNHVRVEHLDLRVVLIGDEVSPYARAMDRAIERLGLGGSLLMAPFRRDLRPWWLAADAGLSTSESESMSASVLEAMAFGLPVLATRVGGIPEVVEDGDNGWLYEPNDLAALIAGLRRVAVADEGTLRRLGASAADRVAPRSFPPASAGTDDRAPAPRGGRLRSAPGTGIGALGDRIVKAARLPIPVIPAQAGITCTERHVRNPHPEGARSARLEGV